MIIITLKTCTRVFVCLPQVMVKPYDVVVVTRGGEGGPGLSGQVVHTNTSLGLLPPSTLDAISCRESERERRGRERRGSGRRKTERERERQKEKESKR